MVDASDLPPGSVAHYRRLSFLNITVIAAVRQLFALAMRQPTVEARTRVWLENLPDLTRLVEGAQEQAVWSGLFANAAALAQQGSYEPPSAWANPKEFTGYTKSGYSVAETLAHTGYNYFTKIDAGTMTYDAARQYLGEVTQGIVSDSARDAVQADILTRHKIAFVRMVTSDNPCARCIVLAGRIYWRDVSYLTKENCGAFERHPQCRCIHVPVNATISLAEHYAQGYMDNPYEYFENMRDKDGNRLTGEALIREQNRKFSKARAQAMRDGADIYSVMGSGGVGKGGSTQSWRQTGYYGKNGWVEARDRQRQTGLTTWAMSRVGEDGPTRLTPKGIYLKADGDREEAIRLLTEHGYIIDRRTISGTPNARGDVVQTNKGPDGVIPHGKHEAIYGDPTAAMKRGDQTDYYGRTVNTDFDFYEDTPLGRDLKAAADRHKARQAASAQQIAEDEMRARAYNIGPAWGQWYDQNH
jgi:hypothetical protein